MSASPHPEMADRLPTLTEIVTPAATQPATPAPTSAAVPVEPVIDEAQLTMQVLAAVQQKIDLMLEYRLREALAPVLARATDGLIKEARNELAATLRDVVSRAVSQELGRRRTGNPGK